MGSAKIFASHTPQNKPFENKRTFMKVSFVRLRLLSIKLGETKWCFWHDLRKLLALRNAIIVGAISKYRLIKCVWGLYSTEISVGSILAHPGSNPSIPQKNFRGKIINVAKSLVRGKWTGA